MHVFYMSAHSVFGLRGSGLNARPSHPVGRKPTEEFVASRPLQKEHAWTGPRGQSDFSHDGPWHTNGFSNSGA